MKRPFTIILDTGRSTQTSLPELPQLAEREEQSDSLPQDFKLRRKMTILDLQWSVLKSQHNTHNSLSKLEALMRDKDDKYKQLMKDY